ncbi:MAG: M20 family metallo-hydrolase [Candidatus Thermoplasmatota archaeon]|nr:M20 family metallo-hydrolase [Candidatus Thermoplasmatota archaeon]
MDTEQLSQLVDARKDGMIKDFCSMLRIKAIAPDSGGEGEQARAEFLVKLAADLGLGKAEVLCSSDPRVPSGGRPNIILRLAGRTDKDLWVVTHMDTVPEGDISAWASPPFDPLVKDGRIYGRGSEDNGQELIASLFALATVKAAGIVPEMNINLAFVADEEQGNDHGIEFLLSKGLFKKGDLAVVPDHGASDGSELEVVEKSILWVNVEVLGKQTHASTPDDGVNALEVAAKYMLKVTDELRAKYADSDPLFNPPPSTFVATRCESNGPNINTIPGKQRFAFDFRVLPEYRLDEILADMNRVAKGIESESGARIVLDVEQRADAPPRTSVDSEVVKRLSVAVRTIKKVEPRPTGMGGGTCATPFRREGIDAVVWASLDSMAHDANEYCVIDNLMSDTKVFALLFAGDAISSAQES